MQEGKRERENQIKEEEHILEYNQENNKTSIERQWMRQREKKIDEKVSEIKKQKSGERKIN